MRCSIAAAQDLLSMLCGNGRRAHKQNFIAPLIISERMEEVGPQNQSMEMPSTPVPVELNKMSEKKKLSRADKRELDEFKKEEERMRRERRAGYKEARAFQRLAHTSREAELERQIDDDTREAKDRALVVERRFYDAEAALVNEWRYEEIRKKYDKIQIKEDKKASKANFKDEVIENRRQLRIKYHQGKKMKQEGGDGVFKNLDDSSDEINKENDGEIEDGEADVGRFQLTEEGGGMRHNNNKHKCDIL